MNSEVVAALEGAKQHLDTNCLINAVVKASPTFEVQMQACAHLYRAANLLDEDNVVRGGGLSKWQARKSKKQKVTLINKAIHEAS